VALSGRICIHSPPIKYIFCIMLSLVMHTVVQVLKTMTMSKHDMTTNKPVDTKKPTLSFNLIVYRASNAYIVYVCIHNDISRLEWSEISTRCFIFFSTFSMSVCMYILNSCFYFFFSSLAYYIKPQTIL
jgi:hypothetical protein